MSSSSPSLLSSSSSSTTPPTPPLSFSSDTNSAMATLVEPSTSSNVVSNNVASSNVASNNNTVQLRKIGPDTDMTGLPDDQRAPIEGIVRAVAARDRGDFSNVFFIWHGPAGSGKTYTIHTLMDVFSEYVKPKDADTNAENNPPPQIHCRVQVAATTGAAAVNIGRGACTIHSLLGLGMGDRGVVATCRSIRKFKKTRDRIKELDILVCDEVSMMRASLFDLIYHVLTQFGPRPDTPFGGIIFILVGDFLQLPPVVTDRDREAWERQYGTQIPFPTFVFQSEIYKARPPRPFFFSTNFRQQNNPRWLQLIQHTRDGIESWTQEDEILLKSRLWPHPKPLPSTNGVIPTVIYTRHVHVNEHNQAELRKLQGERRTYELSVHYPASTMTNPARLAEAENHVKTILENGKHKYERKLELAVGAQVILTHNIDVASELANGSRGVVKELTPAGPVVVFDNGKEHRIGFEVIPVPHMDNRMADIRFMPLILGWCVTLHRCQGMSLSLAALCLDEKSAFEENMVYTALSRVRSLEGLYLRAWDCRSIRVNELVVAYLHDLENGTHPTNQQEIMPPIPLPSQKRKREEKEEKEENFVAKRPTGLDKWVHAGLVIAEKK